MADIADLSTWTYRELIQESIHELDWNSDVSLALQAEIENREKEFFK